MYEVEPKLFLTPRGIPVTVYLRNGTNDHNTAYSALNEDEYRLAARQFAGTVLDIGAHIGTITLGLLVDNPGLRVIAVEPIPENLALLRQNLEANGVADRCEIVSGLAGDGEPGVIRYAFKNDGTPNQSRELIESGLHHAFIGNSSFAIPGGVHQAMHVASWTLSALTSIARPSAVKLDCEGGEWDFLRAASRDDVAVVPLFFGEWHPNPVGRNDNGIPHRRGELVALLPDHDVTFSGPEAGPGGFVATLR